MVLLRVDLLIHVVVATLGHRYLHSLALEWEIDTLVVAATLVFCALGWLAHRDESVPLLASFWTLSLISPVYLWYNYGSPLELWGTLYSTWQLSGVLPHLEVAFFLLYAGFGLALLLLRLVLLFFSVLVARDFGRGFKSVKQNPLGRQEEEQEYAGIDLHEGDSEGEADLTVDDVIRNTYRHQVSGPLLPFEDPLSTGSSINGEAPSSPSTQFISDAKNPKK